MIVYFRDSYEADYVIAGPNRIGSTYKKAVYRAYTDNTYTTELDHPEHLGILGPMLIGEVGDRLVLHFKNTGSYPATMHPHGVFYNKDSEGKALIGLYFEINAEVQVMPGPAALQWAGLIRRRGGGAFSGKS